MKKVGNHRLRSSFHDVMHVIGHRQDYALAAIRSSVSNPIPVAKGVGSYNIKYGCSVSLFPYMLRHEDEGHGELCKGHECSRHHNSFF